MNTFKRMNTNENHHCFARGKFIRLQSHLGNCKKGQSSKEPYNTSSDSVTAQPVRPSGHRITAEWPQMNSIPRAWVWSTCCSSPWFTVMPAAGSHGWWFSEKRGWPVDGWSICLHAVSVTSSSQRYCRAHSRSVGHKGCRDWLHRVQWAWHMRWWWHRGCRAAWDTEPLDHQHARVIF